MPILYERAPYPVVAQTYSSAHNPSPVRHSHSEHRLVIVLVDADHVLNCWRRGIREQRYQQRYVVYLFDVVAYCRDPVWQTGLQNRRRTQRVKQNSQRGSVFKVRRSSSICIAELLQVDHVYLHIPIRVVACHAMRVRLRGVLQRSQRNRAIPVRLDPHTFGKRLTNVTRNRRYKRRPRRPPQKSLPGHLPHAASVGRRQPELGGGGEYCAHPAHGTVVFYTYPHLDVCTTHRLYLASPHVARREIHEAHASSLHILDEVHNVSFRRYE